MLVTVGIALTWLIDRFVLPFAELHLANLFTGFVCGVELWSYLENAADCPTIRCSAGFRN